MRWGASSVESTKHAELDWPDMLLAQGPALLPVPLPSTFS